MSAKGRTQPSPSHVLAKVSVVKLHLVSKNAWALSAAVTFPYCTILYVLHSIVIFHTQVVQLQRLQVVKKKQTEHIMKPCMLSLLPKWIVTVIHSLSVARRMAKSDGLCLRCGLCW